MVSKLIRIYEVDTEHWEEPLYKEFGDYNVKMVPLKDVEKIIQMVIRATTKRIVEHYIFHDCPCPEYECVHIKEIKNEVFHNFKKGKLND